jgi:hypothetical protein
MHKFANFQDFLVWKVSKFSWTSLRNCTKLISKAISNSFSYLVKILWNSSFWKIMVFSKHWYAQIFFWHIWNLDRKYFVFRKSLILENPGFTVALLRVAAARGRQIARIKILKNADKFAISSRG